MKSENILIGAHLSIEGGFEQSIMRAEALGCTVLQIFTKSNRQWAARPISSDDAALFKSTLASSNVKIVAAHASYLINLASDNSEVVQKSSEALSIELNRCDMLSIPYLVLHPGSSAHMKNDAQATLLRVSHAINAVLDATPGSCMVLLEMMAGQGSSVCSTIEQLKFIMNHISHKKRIGVCIDTCHIFAAGYDIAHQKGYDAFFNTFDTEIGIDQIKLFHVNDSKKGCGSRVDRHEHIGKGMIGTDAFSILMNDKRFAKIGKILETPKDNDPHDDSMNLVALRTMIR